MISFWPALGVRFDIGKIESSAYGYECWKALWSAVAPRDLRGSLLFEGDTAATISGTENVFCIVVQNMDPAVLQKLKLSVAGATKAARIAATPMFVEEEDVIGEPLVDVGSVDHAGNLVGRTCFYRDALKATKEG